GRARERRGRRGPLIGRGSRVGKRRERACAGSSKAGAPWPPRLRASTRGQNRAQATRGDITPAILPTLHLPVLCERARNKHCLPPIDSAKAEGVSDGPQSM